MRPRPAPRPGPSVLSHAENWTGGFYETAFEVGDGGRSLQRVLSALWPAAGVEGCFGSRDREPGDQAGVPLTLSSLAEYGHLRGVLTLPSGHRVVCGCVAVRPDDGPAWLSLYLPLGALGATDPRIGAFPFGPDGGPSSLEWRLPLDAWLASTARAVLAEAPFDLAVIGFEPDGSPQARSLNGAPPEERACGVLFPDGRYFPADR
ncbi:hypothetical protein [Nocardiopsis suaedae]|uniref:Uncharacterized protein n=1 Tax=Nocardiopsis suaedae TaxID=3018444 RepID=A0ABT4TWT6_9ACTN|nr:hypothetical protein [Nocardiopsis suaedae]MDA2808881.1 hypothetical protein [Nocardiopsis suaedae]